MKCKHCQRNLGFRLIILGTFYSVTLIAVVLDTDISLKAVVLIAFWAVWAELGACPVRICVEIQLYIGHGHAHVCTVHIHESIHEFMHEQKCLNCTINGFELSAV